MGRDRGQGSQDGTSRIQGRVYAITPQTDPADQSGIQGTFTISQECRLNLDASYSCLLLHLVSMFRA